MTVLEESISITFTFILNEGFGKPSKNHITEIIVVHIF